MKTEHIYFISYSHVHTTGHITFRTSRYCENLMICLNTIVFCLVFLNKVFKNYYNFFPEQECAFMGKSSEYHFSKWVADDCNSTNGFICSRDVGEFG